MNNINENEKLENVFKKDEVTKFCLKPDGNVCISNFTDDFDKKVCAECFWGKKGVLTNS